MDSYLQSLLKRMSDRSYRPGEEIVEGVYESDKSVAWEAYNEARNLEEIELLPKLYELIKQLESENDKAVFTLLSEI